jgi:hypothetical protein
MPRRFTGHSVSAQVLRILKLLQGCQSLGAKFPVHPQIRPGFDMHIQQRLQCSYGNSTVPVSDQQISSRNRWFAWMKAALRVQVTVRRFVAAGVRMGGARRVGRTSAQRAVVDPVYAIDAYRPGFAIACQNNMTNPANFACALCAPENYSSGNRT